MIVALLQTFSKDVGDGQITCVLANLFFTVSQQQEGLRAIVDCGGISRLIQILEFVEQPFEKKKAFVHEFNMKIFSSPENIVNFVITTLHNSLTVFPEQSANEIDRCNGTLNLIRLLQTENDKLLTLVSDCLLKMSTYNNNTKMIIQTNEECIKRLLSIFDTSKYDKLLLIISKLFPIVSSTTETMKRIFLQSNALSIFEKHVRTTRSARIRHNCLIAMRNISDQATRMVKRSIRS